MDEEAQLLRSFETSNRPLFLIISIHFTISTVMSLIMEGNFPMGAKKSYSYQILLVLDDLQVGTCNWHVGHLFVFQVERVRPLNKVRRHSLNKL